MSGKPKWKQVKAICKSVGAGATYFAACKAAGISEMTLWRWRKDVKCKSGKTFGDLLQVLWDRRVTMVEDAHYQSALKGSVKAQENFLYNRARGRWQKDPDIVVRVGDDNSKHLTQIFQTAPQRIVFDDGDGDRKDNEQVPEGCNATPAESLAGAEGMTECQEPLNRIP